jgi:hypothetical protein
MEEGEDGGSKFIVYSSIFNNVDGVKDGICAIILD